MLKTEGIFVYRNEIVTLSGYGFAPGCGVRPLMTGKVDRTAGQHLFFGGYTALHLIASGGGWLKNGEVCFRLSAGDMFSLLPGTVSEYWDDPEDPWEFYWIRLEGPGTDSYRTVCGFSEAHPVVKPGDPDAAISFFRNFHSACRNRIETGADFLASRLFALSALLSRKETAPKRGHHRIFRDFISLCEIPEAGTMNVGEIASLLRIDRTLLHRICREEAGRAPGEILIGKRLEKACRLLEDPACSVARAARAAGYSDPRFFSRIFRRKKGIPPGEWRDSHRIRPET